MWEKVRLDVGLLVGKPHLWFTSSPDHVVGSVVDEDTKEPEGPAVFLTA